jgi:hypothetical protein
MGDPQRQSTLLVIMIGCGEAVIGWIREVVLDAPEPWALARFWAALLGGTPVEWYPGWVTLEPPPHGQRLSFQASSAPPAENVSRVHFDILVEDPLAAHDRVVSAGAVPPCRVRLTQAGSGRRANPVAGPGSRPGTRSAWSSASRGCVTAPRPSTAGPPAPGRYVPAIWRHSACRFPGMS